MGLYLELYEPKLDWCKKQQTRPEQGYHAHESLPVCYLNNGAFDCVALGFSMTEIKRLKASRPDGQWFIVPKATLRAVTAGGHVLKELK